MKALVLTDDEFDMVQAALCELAAEQQDQLDDGTEDSDFRWSVDDARRVADYPGVQLGGLNGVVVTFGDGTDGDTWENLFGYLAREGYGVCVTRTNGERVDGFVTDIDDPEAGFVQDEYDYTLDATTAEAYRSRTGILHGTPVEEVGGIHIY